MKEERYFYVPDALSSSELPEEETGHALKVLRLQAGDSIMLIDGKGNFHKATVSGTDKRHCRYEVVETLPQQRQWAGHLHIAMAPTKNIDRTEWFVEKATEIGFDELTFLDCRFSERRTIRLDRISKIVVSAVKQSRKGWMPILNDMTSFGDFISREFNGDKYICHCYDTDDERGVSFDKPLLKDLLKNGNDALVLVGPEGDFSIDEVREAESRGFHSVSLGHSRLRTETASLAAVHLMHLANEMP